MTFEEVQKQAAELSPKDQRRLTAFLVSLRQEDLTEYRKDLAAKIDDQNEDQWVSFEEFDRRVSAP